MGLLSKFFGLKKTAGRKDGKAIQRNDPSMKIKILEKNAPVEGINDHLIESIRSSLIGVESKYGPFAFVPVEQDRSNKNKYLLIVSAKWVKENNQSAAIIGETVYNNLNADLKPLLGGVRAEFLENVPALIVGKEEDLKDFADIPFLHFNYRFEYADTLSILAYNAQSFKDIK